MALLSKIIENSCSTGAAVSCVFIHELFERSSGGDNYIACARRGAGSGGVVVALPSARVRSCAELQEASMWHNRDRGTVFNSAYTGGIEALTAGLHGVCPGCSNATTKLTAGHRVLPYMCSVHGGLRKVPWNVTFSSSLKQG